MVPITITEFFIDLSKALNKPFEPREYEAKAFTIFSKVFLDVVPSEDRQAADKKRTLTIQSLKEGLESKKPDKDKRNALDAELSLVRQSFFRDQGVTEEDKLELLYLYRMAYVRADGAVQIARDIDPEIQALKARCKSPKRVSWQLPLSPVALGADQLLEMQRGKEASNGIGNQVAILKGRVRDAFMQVLQGDVEDLHALAIMVHSQQDLLVREYESLFCRTFDANVALVLTSLHELERQLEHLIDILDVGYILMQPYGKTVLKLEEMIRGVIQNALFTPAHAYSFYHAGRIICELKRGDKEGPLSKSVEALLAVFQAIGRDVFDSLAKENSLLDELRSPKQTSLVVLRTAKALFFTDNERDSELELVHHLLAEGPLNDDLRGVIRAYKDARSIEPDNYIIQQASSANSLITQASSDIPYPFAYLRAWQIAIELKCSRSSSSVQFAAILIKRLEAHAKSLKYVAVPEDLQGEDIPKAVTLATFKPYLLRVLATCFYGTKLIQRSRAEELIKAIFENRSFDDALKSCPEELKVMLNKYIADKLISKSESSVGEFTYFVNVPEKEFIEKPEVRNSDHHAVSDAVFSIIRREQARDQRPIAEHFTQHDSGIEGWYEEYGMYLASTCQNLGVYNALTPAKRALLKKRLGQEEFSRWEARMRKVTTYERLMK